MSYPSIKDHKGISDWFKSHCEEIGLTVKREVKIKNHIADLLVNEKLVIEIQVTPLTTQKIFDRIETYVELGYRPIWVLSGDYYNQANLDTLADSPSKITKFERLLASGEFSTQKYIYYYGEGWLWRGEPNYHIFKSSLAWINLKRCGFETQIRGLIYD